MAVAGHLHVAVVNLQLTSFSGHSEECWVSSVKSGYLSYVSTAMMKNWEVDHQYQNQSLIVCSISSASFAYPALSEACL